MIWKKIKEDKHWTLTRSKRQVVNVQPGQDFAALANSEDFSHWNNEGYITYSKFVHIEDSELLPSGNYIATQNSNYDNILIPIEVDLTPRLDLYSHFNLISEIENFSAKKEVYKKFKIPYKRGYLFYGPPGTGKTTLIKDALTNLKIDALGIFISGNQPDSDLTIALNKETRLKIIVIEEITEAFNDTSELLDFLDGVVSLDNTVIIATTNYPNKLPENIVNRPSRLDVIQEIGYLENKEIEKIFKFYGREDAAAVLEELHNQDITFSHIKEICLKSELHDISLEESYRRVQEQISRVTRSFKKIKLGFDQ